MGGTRKEKRDTQKEIITDFNKFYSLKIKQRRELNGRENIIFVISFWTTTTAFDILKKIQIFFLKYSNETWEEHNVIFLQTYMLSLSKIPFSRERSLFE